LKPSQAIRFCTAGAAVAGMLATGSSAAWAAVPRFPAAAPGGAAATLILQTVPAVTGVAVSLDGATYRTGPGGLVAIPTTSGPHWIKILHPVSASATSRIRFARWRDGIALTDREITIGPGTNTAQAGFVVSRPIAFRFTDKDGNPVPLSEVEQVALTNGVGQRFAFPPARPPGMFAAERIVRNTSGLHTLPIRYSVRTVLMDGSDVVFGGSQSFFVGRNHLPWTVKVLVFPLQVKVRDALFKFPIGDAVRLTLPNGSRRIIRLGPGHEAMMAGLPRGSYELVSIGPGLGLSAPASLSGPQADTLLILSWIDLLVVAVFALLFLVGLPLAGGRIARMPGRGRRLAWQAGPAGPAYPAGEPLSAPAHAGTLSEHVAAASMANTPDAAGGMADGTEAHHATKVMPAVWDMEASVAHTRGKRRRPR
jgi:hypothetical protein